jgi:alkanesulfonate monooxygenase SsuD/methylene tetrahydromethanopterin reductase-like flavin-dependent oxidoreductase (luciferase family)
VTDPFRRHPFITAQAIATLDYLSGGRALLAIGAGHEDLLSPFGIKFENPLARLREAIALMKLLWTRKDADYNGRFYRLSFRPPMYPNLSSAIIQKPYPPIYIGSLSGRRMRELTGEIAQGFFPYLCPPRLYRKWVDDIKVGAKKSGRSIDQIDTCAFLNIAFSENHAAARKEAEKLRESIIGYPYLFGPELGYEPLPAQARYEAHSLSRRAPFELVEELAAIGSAKDCIDKVEEYVKAGAKHILVRKVTPKRYRELFEMIKTRVMPCFS